MIKKSQHEDNVKLRDLARSRGDKYCEATRPCKHGHLIRRVSDNRCDACGKAKDKRAKEKMLSTPEGKAKHSKWCTDYQVSRYKEDPEYRRTMKLRARLNYHKAAVVKLTKELEG